MKRFVLLACGACLTGIIALSGCSVSNGALKDADQRIASLKERGVPDSSLSRAIVFLYQARDAKKRGNMGLARQSRDSMRVLIAQAEAQYEQDMQRLRPFLDSCKVVFKKTGAELSSYQKVTLDSTVGVIDSLMAINWLIPAEAEARALLKRIPRLKLDEEVANEHKGKIPGTWVCEQVTKHSQDKTVHAVQEKIFTFKNNGDAVFIEKKKGKSSPGFKEDWEYRSWGKWGLSGDTIKVAVDRFAAIRQNFEELHNENGQKTWEKKTHPNYDSTITDGSQDRFIVFNDLLTDFKKK